MYYIKRHEKKGGRKIGRIVTGQSPLLSKRMCKLRKKKKGEKIKPNKTKSQKGMKANNHNKPMPKCKPNMESRSPMNTRFVRNEVHEDCLQ